MLKLLHPFMPFITEEIWGYLPETNAMLIKEAWPQYEASLSFEKEEEKIELIMEIIRGIRNIRAEADTLPSKKLNAVISAEGKAHDYVSSGERYIKSLANISEITFTNDKEQIPEDAMSAVVKNVEIYIPLDQLIDFNAELERLEKEADRLQNELERVEMKLKNESFISKAPQKVVDGEKEKKQKYQDMMEKVSERIEIIKRKIG